MAPDELISYIVDGLAVLRLTEMRRAIEEVLASPVPDETRLEWLWRIIEPQVRLRLERRTETRIRYSRLPERKTLESFRFEFQAKLDKDFILHLATLRFLDQGRNLLFAGDSGTGKSHLSKALALIACSQNRRVLYTTSADMLARLNAGLADQTLEQVLKPYTSAELLVIDEVGLEQVERKEACRCGLMQKVLVPRYTPQQRSTIITSNIPWEGWGDYLDDHLGAVALLDRLIHHSHVISIQGPSYREFEHEQQVATEKIRPLS